MENEQKILKKLDTLKSMILDSVLLILLFVIMTTTDGITKWLGFAGAILAAGKLTFDVFRF